MPIDSHLPQADPFSLVPTFKDIVQPKKRGEVKIRRNFVLNRRCFLVGILNYSRALIFQNPVTALRAKKGGVFFMWNALPKTRRLIVVKLRYSPCDDTPDAATVAVTACRVSLLSSKNIEVAIC